MKKKAVERPIVVPALEKALDVLEYLVYSQRDMTVGELSTALRIPQASAFRIVNTLVHRGYLTKHSDGRVSLGPRNALLSRAYTSSNELCLRAQRYLGELRTRTGHSVELAHLDEDEIAFIDVLESTMPVTVRLTRTVGAPLIGSSNPITMVILSHLPDDRRDRVLDRMEIARISHLHVRPVLEKFSFDHAVDSMRLEQVRKDGYAADYGEQAMHVTRIAAPVFGADGEVVGSLGVAGPTVYLPTDGSEAAIEAVVAMACALSSEFG